MTYLREMKGRRIEAASAWLLVALGELGNQESFNIPKRISRKRRVQVFRKANLAKVEQE